MTGQVVTHVRFGEGRVIDFAPPRITIEFQDHTTKTFAYPQAVERFLSFADPLTEVRARRDLEQARVLAAEDARARIEERRQHEEELTRQRLEAIHDKKVAAARRSAARSTAARAAKSAAGKTTK